jgi:hypothetical protein
MSLIATGALLALGIFVLYGVVAMIFLYGFCSALDEETKNREEAKKFLEEENLNSLKKKVKLAEV